MHGLMQDWPLRVSRIIDHAARFHPRRGGDRPQRRGADRPQRLGGGARAARCRSRSGWRATALGRGDVVGVMAWNTAAAARGLVRRAGRRRGAAHAEPAALARPARLHRQPRRRPDADGRPRPRAGRSRASATGWRRVERHRRADRRRAHARGAARTRSPTRTGSPRRTATSPGSRATSATPAASATPPAPPATRRAWSTPTARTCCTRWPLQAPDVFGLSSRDAMMPVVPLFHANGWSHRLRRAAGRRGDGAAGARPDPRRALRDAGDGRHDHRRGADGLAGAAGASRRERPAASRRSSGW